MTPEIAKKWLPIIQAVAEGKTIQALVNESDVPGACAWCDVTGYGSFPSPIVHTPDNYRIKPEPRKPIDFWITRSDGIYLGVHVSREIARKFMDGNYPDKGYHLIHVREVIDE